MICVPHNHLIKYIELFLCLRYTYLWEGNEKAPKLRIICELKFSVLQEWQRRSAISATLETDTSVWT